MVWAVEVITTWVAVAVVIVSVCTAEVSVPEATVIVGLPTVVSLKKNPPVPDAMATDVTVPSNGPELLVSNRIVPEDEDKFAVPLNVVTRLLKVSCTSNVTCADAAPAATV
jgi:hypothetical protein